MGSSLCIGIVKDLQKKKTEEKKIVTKEEEMIVTVLDLPEIPQELMINILIRMPVKSLMRFKCVSKLWLSLITSQYFTNLFLKSSPRSRLFAYFVDNEKQSEYELLTTLNYHHNSDTDVSVIDQDLTMQRIGGGCFVSSVRGLVCFRNEGRVRICNLNTRQVLELPMIKGNNYKNVWNCFGHDHVNDEYKVLTTIWNATETVVRSEHYVLVLGPKASWKKIHYHIPHRPFRVYSKGVIINSVLYYRALTDANRYVVMSFDFSSEKFKLIELPNVNDSIFGDFSCVDLMNYKGKVAVLLCFNVLNDGIVYVWVLEDGSEKKSQWSDKKTLVLPVSQMNFVGTDQLRMGGTSRSGLVWLTKAYISRHQPAWFFIYDLERNEISRTIEIRPILGSFENPQVLLFTFWDDIESIMYLEI